MNISNENNNSLLPIVTSKLDLKFYYFVGIKNENIDIIQIKKIEYIQSWSTFYLCKVLKKCWSTFWLQIRFKSGKRFNNGKFTFW